MLERIPRRLDIRGPRASFVMTDVIADEVPGDAELHIGFDVLVVWHVELRDQSLESGFEHQKMQMSRPHIVTTLRTQQFADRTVDRNRIAGRFNATETDVA